MEKALAIFERGGERERESEERERGRELKEHVYYKMKRTIVCGSELVFFVRLTCELPYIMSPIRPSHPALSDIAVGHYRKP